MNPLTQPPAPFGKSKDSGKAFNIPEKVGHIFVIIGVTSFTVPLLLWFLLHRLRNRGVRHVRAGPHRPPSVGPVWVRTWHGWETTETHERRHERNKKWRRRIQFDGFRSATQDYSWIFWDPGGHGQREYREQRNQSVLRYLPGWMRSYPHGWSMPDRARPEVWASDRRRRPSVDVERAIERVELSEAQAQDRRVTTGHVREHQEPHDADANDNAAVPEPPRVHFEDGIDPFDSAATIGGNDEPSVDPLDSADTVGHNNEFRVDGAADACHNDPAVTGSALVDLAETASCSTETVMRHSLPSANHAGSRVWGAGSDETDRATHYQLLRPGIECQPISRRSGGDSRRRYPGAQDRAHSLPLLVAMRTKAQARGRERRLSSAPEPAITPVVPAGSEVKRADERRRMDTSNAESLSHYATPPSSKGTSEASDADSAETSDQIIDDFSILTALLASRLSEDTPRLRPRRSREAVRIPSFALDGAGPGGAASSATPQANAAIRRRVPSRRSADSPTELPRARTPAHVPPSVGAPSVTDHASTVRRRTPSGSRSLQIPDSAPRTQSPARELLTSPALAPASLLSVPDPPGWHGPAEHRDARIHAPKIRSTKKVAQAFSAQRPRARAPSGAGRSPTPTPGVHVPTGLATVSPRGTEVFTPRVDGDGPVAKVEIGRGQKASANGAWWRWHRGP